MQSIETSIGLIKMAIELQEFSNIVDSEYQKKLYNAVTDVTFPWHYLEDTTYERATKPGANTPGFTHLLFNNNGTQSDYFEMFKPVFENGCAAAGLKPIGVIRFRLGFLLKTRYNLPSQPYVYNQPHVDCDFDHYTALYYLNKSDGDTVIFDQTEASEKYIPRVDVTPEMGKFAVFNGRHYHASTCPKMLPSRIVLTMNFTAEKI
jgi:hypothetical protein